MKTPGLQLAFYGDDFTGSTDALEQLSLAGIRTVLFLEPPSTRQLAGFKGVQAVGVAGLTRSLRPSAMEAQLVPAFRKLKALRPRHVHYKVCSTFDSSPGVGSIGRAIDVGRRLFPAPFIPLLVAAPRLGRYCVFGNLFARFGIGSQGAIHRLDRHPSISRHPITPMRESDLLRHLAKQTRKQAALLDLLSLSLPQDAIRTQLRKLIQGGAEVVLFDALYEEQLKVIGELIEGVVPRGGTLFSVGSSGIETALGACWDVDPKRALASGAAMKGPLLVGSGSCSEVTKSQVAWAERSGFAAVVSLEPTKLLVPTAASREIEGKAEETARRIESGRSVIVTTARRGADQDISRKLGARTAQVLGTALGEVIRRIVERSSVRRVCIAGGDTSSFAARAMGIDAIEMTASLTPGAPLCRVRAAGSALEECEWVFKGGQVGAENYFETVKNGL